MMAHIFWTSIILAAGVYGALCLYLFLMQGKLLYYPDIPSRDLTANPGDRGLPYETVSITTSDRFI